MTYTKHITGEVKPAKKTTSGPAAMLNAIKSLDKKLKEKGK